MHDERTALKQEGGEMRGILKRVREATVKATEQDRAVNVRNKANLPSSTVCETNTTSATCRDNSSGCLAV